MKKIEMIKYHREFSEMIQKKKYIKNKEFTIYIRKSIYDFSHYGIAVSKKLGNAVTRNKLKRRMRSILDECKKSLPNNQDYIIIMKENTKNISYQELKNSFQNLMKIKGETNETKK